MESQANEGKGWLDVEGEYQHATANYYFTSMVCRFLAFYAAARLFLKSSIYVDARYASGKDIRFIKYLKETEWVATDVAIFSGLEYDSFEETDHLFRGTLKAGAEGLLTEEGSVIPETTFAERLKSKAWDARLESVLKFFDGLRAAEERYRWDRIIALHLVVMGFMYEFGYDMQRPSKKHFAETAVEMENIYVARNLVNWLKKLSIFETKSGLLIRSGVNQLKFVNAELTIGDKVRLLRG